MSKPDPKLIKQIFEEAADLPPESRGEWLRRRCGTDSRLHAEVAVLLDADSKAQTGFLPTQSTQLPSESTPARIAHFQIVRRIAEGGMGAVFEGRQDHPRRTVALKVIRVAMASESIRRRFEYEVQILGQLKHPGIAQIYEAGTYNDGTGTVPYFAMEYVQGRTLIDFANHQKLKARDRLSLLAEVCDAVQHAHQKGVIHRDLKPANILVELNGSAPQPKILDFGVARATHCDIQQVTMHTEPGQIVGTLSYMSPEQVAGNPDQIDVRSDVYSLGVILYELLADQLPYNIVGRSISEAGAIIREQEPSRLSSIHSVYRGDVETIVVKALAKEKERRYQSPSELAEDIRRYLRDEPIIARPTSRAYQIRKFAKRNKGIVAGVAAVFVILIAGIIGVSIAFLRATKAEKTALLSSEESRRLAVKATAVSNFLQEMLSSADPAQSLGREVTVLHVLEEAAKKIDSGMLKDQPELESELQATVGTTYLALGRYAEAEPPLRAALETRKALHQGAHRDIATSLDQLGSVVLNLGRHAEATALHRQTLDMLRQLHGERHVEVASAMQSYAAVLRAQGKYNEAEPLYRKALEIRRELLGEDHLDVAQSINSLGLLLQNKNDYAGAEKYFREALAMRRKLLGDPHPVVADALNNLANLLHLRNNDEEAEALLKEALEMRKRLLGSRHPQIAQSTNNLAVFFHDKAEHAKAEPLFREALAIWRETLPAKHADIGNAAAGLGATLIALKKNYPEAETILREAHDIRNATLPERHPGRFTAMSALGAALAGQGKFEEAEILAVGAYTGLKDQASVPSKSKSIARERIVQMYEWWGKPDLAEEWRLKSDDR